MGYPVVHFEINSSGAPELVRFYADAFGWNIHQDGHDYAQIQTEGVCAGSGAPGIDGGIGTAEPGDDFVTIYVQVPDVQEALEKVLALGGNVEMPGYGGRSSRHRDLSRSSSQSPASPSPSRCS